MAPEHEQNDPSLQEWVIMAQAWIDSFPQATEVTMSEVEAWVDSNLSSLPEGLRSVPRPDIYLRLIITSNRLRLERSRCENHVSKLAYSVHEVLHNKHLTFDDFFKMLAIVFAIN